jgi:ribosomal subunit interface protein
MIESLQISGVHAKHPKKTDDYVKQKIGPLDRYVPKHAKGSLKVEVKLKESKAKNKASCECEVIMHLPKDRLTVHEKATSMTAAIDLCEAKLKVQLKKYKDKHAVPRLHRRLLSRLRRQDNA